MSWELIEGALRRLHEEKGEDIMATNIGSQISGRNYIGPVIGKQASSRANARHCVNPPPDEMFR
jgi:hypothetical protein